jgi:putative YhbY family RNA-binding protein
MPRLELTPAERRAHRAAAHHLDPVVLIGAAGATAAVVAEVDAALKAHGLVKVRAMVDDRAARDALLGELANRLDAAPVQLIGKLLVLWRPVPPKERPRDEARKPGPRIVKIVKASKSPTHRPSVKKVRVLGNQRVTAGGSVKRRRAAPVSPKKRAGSR